jgi:hypothetical protein
MGKDEFKTLRARHFLFLGLVSAISLGAYLAASAGYFRLGFPLDDAWIHQTYARNLAWNREWAYLPGQPSAGSTAPAWSALLAIGYALGLGPFGWTFLVGWGLLWGIAILAYLAHDIPGTSQPGWGLWAGTFMALEWHLVWAAGSGMETLLLAGIALFVISAAIRTGLENPIGRSPGRFMRWIVLGALVGASTWIRPDGITLLAATGWAIAFGKGRIGDKLRYTLAMLVGFCSIFLPYLLFNKWLAGELWPNTFYAKQAEYWILREAPYWRRLLNEAFLPLIGAGLVLLPGFAWGMLGSIRRRAWIRLAGPLWVLGYLGLYAWRLPVTYQHGRYVIPMMPVFFLWGMAGLVGWVQPAWREPGKRAMARAWTLACGAILVVFWITGGRAYAQDVSVIESEMVQAAHWIAENTPTDALIAAHDIGALGYFGKRDLLDLAGLISPQVIPMIRDESALAKYIDFRRADYLMTFPGWYPKLSRQGDLVYSTEGKFSRVQSGENMAVFQWNSP